MQERAAEVNIYSLHGAPNPSTDVASIGRIDGGGILILGVGTERAASARPLTCAAGYRKSISVEVNQPASYCGTASLPACHQSTIQRMRDTRAAPITFVSREVHSERWREQRIIVPQIPQSRWFLFKNRRWNIP
ncbi:hypothetical protein [Bradyrhizobium sp. USDA 4454]